MKDRLYLLKSPFEDGGADWYCNDCATLEGALLANPQWGEKIEVRRIGFPRPRAELVELVGDQYQGLPMLVMPAEGAPAEALRIGAYAILKDVRQIGALLARRHGGVGPHP